MERYSHIQAMPNSPLTPLIPLSENTAFEFNFGGDGSLDKYIDSIRQEHRVEQQKKKLLQQANSSFHKKDSHIQPKHYSEEFLKIREVFETQNKQKAHHCCLHKEQQQQDIYDITPKNPSVKITHTAATPTHLKSVQTATSAYEATPTNVRTPLKPRNMNVPQNVHSKAFHALQQQKIQQKCLLVMQQQQQQLKSHPPGQLKPIQNRNFRQASPVAHKPLCPQVARILQDRGLPMYCSIFQREEIDLYTFHLLTLQDLHQIGITNQKHCAIIMQDIYYAGKYF